MIHHESASFKRSACSTHGWRPKRGGAFPSIRGDISISWAKEAGGFLSDVTLPDQMEGELVLEGVAFADVRIDHHGAEYLLPAGERLVVGVELSEDTLILSVRGGTHHLNVLTM